MKSILDDPIAFDAMVRKGAKEMVQALDCWASVYGLDKGDLSMDEGGNVFATEKGQKNRELCPYKDGAFPGISEIRKWYKTIRRQAEEL